MSFWIILVVNAALATYAAHAICWQVQHDRRCPSRDRIMAIRAAYWTAIIILSVGAALWLTQDKRYAITTEWMVLGCIAASVVAALAIRILRGDGRPT